METKKYNLILRKSHEIAMRIGQDGITHPSFETTKLKFTSKKYQYYLTLPNLTKDNLRSHAPNPAGASTHPS